MGEAIGDREVIGGVRRFPQVEEVAGTQEGFVGGQQGVVERLLTIQTRLDEGVVATQGLLVDWFAGGPAYEMSQQGLGVGGRDVRGEKGAIGSIRRGRLERSFDLHPLESDAWLAAGRKRRVPIGGRAAFDVPSQGDGQAEQAVFKGLFCEQSDGRLVSGRGGLDVQGAAGGADVAGDIRAGWLTRPEGHRDRVDGRGEDVAFLLEDGAGGETDSVIARLGGDESFRVSEVWPVGGPEEGEFDGGVFGDILGFQLLGAQRTSVSREEHSLFVSEGIVRRKKCRADEAIGLRFRRGSAGAHRLT